MKKVRKAVSCWDFFHSFMSLCIEQFWWYIIRWCPSDITSGFFSKGQSQKLGCLLCISNGPSIHCETSWGDQDSVIRFPGLPASGQAKHTVLQEESSLWYVCINASSPGWRKELQNRVIINVFKTFLFKLFQISKISSQA